MSTNNALIRDRDRIGEQADSLTMRVSVRPSRLITLLLACTGVLTALSLIANIMWATQSRGAETAVHLFSVDQEGSLPTWWSALLLAALGGLTWLVARSRKHKGWAERVAWTALAGGFLFLSIDESCSLHERIGQKVQLQNAFHHARWVLLWLPPACLATIAILWQLWRVSHRLVLGMTLGIIVFLSGAVGIESVNARYRYNAETQARTELQSAQAANTDKTLRDWRVGASFYPYMFGTALEELLETLGPIIWFSVLLTQYREQKNTQQQALKTTESRIDNKPAGAIA